MGAWPFATEHLILVGGTNKIVRKLEGALDRIQNYTLRLENVRAKKAYGTLSVLGNCVVLAHEKIKGRIILVLVNEVLGH